MALEWGITKIIEEPFVFMFFDSRGTSGRVLGVSWAVLEAPWRDLRDFKTHLLPFGGSFERRPGSLELSWSPSWALVEFFGTSLSLPEVFFCCSGLVWSQHGAILGCLGAFSGLLKASVALEWGITKVIEKPSVFQCVLLH